MPDRLTALDATFLELEQHDEGATMHIGGVMVFDPLPDGCVPALEAVRSTIGSRLVRLPRYSQRLSCERTGGLAWPYWCEDRRFDVRNHVQHAELPAPGGERELCEWAGDFFSHRLDRTRPLWEMTLLTGLARGRWALASKTHHALVDGVGSVGVVGLLLDTEPVAPPAPPATEGPDAPWQVPAPAGESALAGAARDLAHVAGAGIHLALHPRDTVKRSRSLLELVVRNELVAAPRTSLNVPIGATRRFRIVRAPLAELKAIGHQLEVSVNDVLLAGCTAGLRELLLSRGEHLPAEGLRAMVPMNVRSDPERLALGNRVSSLFVELPVIGEHGVERLQTIAQQTRALKSSNAALGAATMIDLAALAPPMLHGLLARSLYATRLFNLTITNVPGPQVALHCLGAPLREVYPLVPLAAEHCVGIAVFSYNGSVAIGISADCDSCPDLDVLVAGIDRELDALRALAPTGARKRRTASARNGRAPTGRRASRPQAAGA
jgi:diacylglycerol O-acyltransferase / wax synthase